MFPLYFSACRIAIVFYFAFAHGSNFRNPIVLQDTLIRSFWILLCQFIFRPNRLAKLCVDRIMQVDRPSRKVVVVRRKMHEVFFQPLPTAATRLRDSCWPASKPLWRSVLLFVQLLPESMVQSKSRIQVLRMRRPRSSVLARYRPTLPFSIAFLFGQTTRLSRPTRYFFLLVLDGE